MKPEQDFHQILTNCRQTLRQARPGKSCPSIDELVHYVGNHDKKINNHLLKCDRCRALTKRIEADEHLWNMALDNSPNTALSLALGEKGQKLVQKLQGKKADKQPCFISQIKEQLVEWVSPLWQPMYAGEAVTAANLETQHKKFEMEYGEYINLSCHWKEDKENKPCIKLSWQANLMQASKLWARFVDPDSSRTIATIPLGSELEGKICIFADQLPFNPTSDKWAIAIVIEK